MVNIKNMVHIQHKIKCGFVVAAYSMVPTTTGAAKAVALVLPQLKGKLNGMAIRVPTPNVSLVDLVFQSEKSTTIEEINAALVAAADGNLKGVLGYVDQPLVSIDMVGNSNSSIVDLEYTTSMGDNLFKVLSDYFSGQLLTSSPPPF